MGKLASLIGGISKSYLYTTLAKEGVRFLRRSLSDIDFDRDEWLHKAGLTSYRRGSGVALFVTGALAGAGVALALAPKKGKDLRSDVKDRAMTLFNRVEQDVEGRTAARS